MESITSQTLISLNSSLLPEKAVVVTRGWVRSPDEEAVISKLPDTKSELTWTRLGVH